MNFEEIARNLDTAALMEYRTVTEVAIIQNAATKVTAADIRDLRAITAQMETVRDDPATLSQYDFDFHSRIAAATRNQLLIITFNTIRSVYEDFTEKMFEADAYAFSLEDHTKITDALEARNVVLSGEMMYRQLSNVQHHFNTLQ